MKREIRNPKSHRSSEANALRTQQRIEQYYGLCELLATWEAQPDNVQIREHDYIIALRAKIRNVRNYLQNRNDAKANIVNC